MRVAVGVVLPAAVLFAAAGRLDWPAGWVYLVLVGTLTLANRWLMLRRSPELAAERMESFGKKDMKGWDRALAPLVALGPALVWLAAGLDRRYGWSPALANSTQVTALVLVALSYALGHWATAVNPFFSGVVRIQKERGHRVIERGPYRHVRHPGYVSAILFSLATGPALGSRWALIPAGLVVLLIIIRTALEDKTLQGELDGYREYAAQVRYRLVPGLW